MIVSLSLFVKEQKIRKIKQHPIIAQLESGSAGT